ncbi:MAG: fimbrillin family protein [Alistipes sp.]|nr:fimbrillin family protein [Alistipes sp.]
MKTCVKNAALSMLSISALLFAGCSKTEQASLPTDGAAVEMLLSAGSVKVPGSISAKNTRAVIDSSYETDLEVAFARLDQDTDGNYPADYTDAEALPATWKVNTTSNTLPAKDEDASNIVFDTKQYYISRSANNSSKLVGWYPDNEVADGVVTFDIDGETDVMLTEVLEGNKNAKFGIYDATAPTDPAKTKIFHFEHQLALLKVKAYATDADAEKVWGKIKSIVIKDQLPECKITLPATVEFEGEAADLDLVKKLVADDSDIEYDLSVGIADQPADPEEGDDEEAAEPAEGEEPAELKNNAVECGYALIPPVKAAEDATLTLVVETVEGGKLDVTVPADKGFEAGTSYDIVLKFTAVTIEPKATITDWVPSEEGEIEITL